MHRREDRPHGSFTDWIRNDQRREGPAHWNRIHRFDQRRVAEAHDLERRRSQPDCIPKANSDIEVPLRTWWFGELIDVRHPRQADQIVAEAVEC